MVVVSVPMMVVARVIVPRMVVVVVPCMVVVIMPRVIVMVVNFYRTVLVGDRGRRTSTEPCWWAE